MTNIFNKTVLVNNGTLVGNWYEEQVLREKTGEGRTIPGKHIPKKSMNFERESNIKAQKDETFSRVMGERLDTNFKTNNETYGKFSDVENKYKKTGVKEKIFEDFFKAYVNNEQSEKNKLDESIKNIRLYDSTNRNIYINQPYENLNSLGKRHMKTQDDIPVNSENIDKNFLASHNMSKFPSVINHSQIGGYIDKYIPYYKDKEVTYWSMNLDKGNIYRTHTLGENAFAKSSGFTQPIQLSKSIKQFNGNVTNSNTSKNVFLDKCDDEFSEKFKNSVLQKDYQEELTPIITQKVMDVCLKKGWMGLRKLKIFLRNVNKKKSNLIDKSNFKYFFINFGIVFTEKEVDFIYNKFDTKRNNHIDFMEFLSIFIYFPEERKNLINSFYESIKNNNNSNVSFKKLEKLFKSDQHPEALYCNRTSSEVSNDYMTSWDNLKLDDIVSQQNFYSFFADMSSCVESDEFYVGCIRSCGMNI